MSKKIKAILGFFAFMAIGYLAYSFVTFNYDVFIWQVGNRIYLLLLPVIPAVVSYIVEMFLFDD